MFFDKRPLNEILNDEIPEQRWSDELHRIQQQGYVDWQDYLKSTKAKGDNNG